MKELTAPVSLEIVHWYICVFMHAPGKHIKDNSGTGLSTYYFDDLHL